MFLIPKEHFYSDKKYQCPAADLLPPQGPWLTLNLPWKMTSRRKCVCCLNSGVRWTRDSSSSVMMQNKDKKDLSECFLSEICVYRTDPESCVSPWSSVWRGISVWRVEMIQPAAVLLDTLPVGQDLNLDNDKTLNTKFPPLLSQDQDLLNCNE